MKSLNLTVEDVKKGVFLWHANLKRPSVLWSSADGDMLLETSLESDHTATVTLAEINSSMVLEIWTADRVKSWVHRERESRTEARDRALSEFYYAEQSFRALESACMVANRYFEK